MSKYLDLSLKEINKLLKDKKIKPIDLVEEAFENIEKNKDINSFITLDKENAFKVAKELENKEVDNLLFGIPIAIKDNICTKNLRTTCASKMLENFIPNYDATVVEKIKSKNMIIIGKTNMDEFAMGSTSRTSYFGAPKNPWNKKRIAGGSSGGSASCISSRIVPFALGSDTGGSIRQPASYCGIVGMKPTYGRISRYGLVAFGSSLDQIGPMTRNVYENAELLNILCGKDEKDLTSIDKEKEDFTSLINTDIKGMNIAIPKYFVTDIVEKEVLDKFNEIVEILKEKGCNIEYIDILRFKKKIWITAFSKHITELDELISAINEANEKISHIIEIANTEKRAWHSVIDEFGQRFSVPFRVSVGNQQKFSRWFSPAFFKSGRGAEPSAASGGRSEAEAQ